MQNGTYYENAVVTKSVALFGENKNTTVVVGIAHSPVWESVISVWVDDVKIANLTEDTTPPVIANVTQQPAKENVYPDDKVIVYANVTDDQSGVKEVVLNYTTNNGTWFMFEIANLEGNLYNATIPEFPISTNVTYLIIAEDNVNNNITTREMEYNYQYHVISEFPSVIILPLLMIATLLAVILCRRNSMKNVLKVL